MVLPVSKRLKKPFRVKRHKAKQQKACCVLYELLRKSYSKLLEVRQGSALRLFDSFRELTGGITKDRRISREIEAASGFKSHDFMVFKTGMKILICIPRTSVDAEDLQKKDAMHNRLSRYNENVEIRYVT